MAERKGKEEEKDKEGGNSWKVRRSFFFFLLHCTACRFLVPRPGTEPMPPPVHVWILNEWATKEVLTGGSLIWQGQQELRWVGDCHDRRRWQRWKEVNRRDKEEGRGWEAEMNERDGRVEKIKERMKEGLRNEWGCVLGGEGSRHSSRHNP